MVILCFILLIYCITNFTNCGESCFPHWIKSKKATINPKNNNDNFFKYAEIVTLNHEEIRKKSESISKIKRFIDKYNWKGIDYSSGKDDCKNSRKIIQ